MSNYLLYNGVKLPKLPESVLGTYPYCWIRKHLTDNQYQLIFGSEPWYYTNGTMTCSAGSSAIEPWYNVAIDDTAADAWIFYKDTTGTFSIDANRIVMWANHDVYNGSASNTTTTPYLKGTAPVNPNDISLTEISYNGAVIATMGPGEEATIKTANTEVEHDIIITAGIPETANLQELSVNENGVVTPALGYDGFSKVTVNVPIPDGYIQPTGNLAITENKDNIDVKEYAEVSVNVPIPDGYIQPAGNLSIDENGEGIDVAEYASVSVNVPIPEGYLEPTGSKEILQNGTGIDVRQYATVDVAVPTENVPEWDKEFTKVEGAGEPATPGTCTGEHVISVSQLPSTNIDRDAVYSAPGEFKNLIIVYTDGVMDFLSLVANMDMWTYSFNSCKTFPTVDIKQTEISGSSNAAYHWYYIEDENDIFLYGDLTNTGTPAWYSYGELESEGVEYKGLISDISEINGVGYYAVGSAAYYKYKPSVVDVYDDGVFMREYFAENLPDLPLILYYCQTRPTTGLPSSLDAGLNYYYVEDERDLLEYNSSGEWSSVTSGNGLTDVIESVDEITDSEGMYVIISYWQRYAAPTGTLYVNKNGTFDVASYSSVSVRTTSSIAVRYASDLPQDAVDGSFAIVFYEEEIINDID